MGFKKRYSIHIVVLTGLVLYYLQACTEKKYIIQDDTIKLSGLILACYCDPCGTGWYPNPEYETRYSVATGKVAKVSFVALSGNMCTVNTDDSSTYSIFLDSGTYKIIVETGHTFPDTFKNVSVTKDSELNLAIAYDWLVGDTIWINFRYENDLDTIGMSAEVNEIKELNYLIGGGIQEVFNIREVKTYNFINDTITYVIYSIPINPDRFLWEVYERSFRLLNTPNQGFPDGMGIGLSWYACQGK